MRAVQVLGDLSKGVVEQSDARPLVVGPFFFLYVWTLPNLFASCLYCYRDELAEKVRKTTAQE